MTRQHVPPLSATVHMPSVRRYCSALSRGVFRHGIVGGRVRHQFSTTSRPVMNSPAKAEARDRANTAPLQSHPGDQRRGLTGQSSGPEAAQPVIATAPNQFRGATNPPGAMSAITGSACGCPILWEGA
jgi:hypothetical protein